MITSEQKLEVSIKTSNVNIALLRPDIWRETQGDTSQQKGIKGAWQKQSRQ